jgi:hypothetical protein
MLAAALSTGRGVRGAIQVWDLRTGQPAASLTLPQMGEVVDVEFRRGGAGDGGGALVLGQSDADRIRLFRCDACLPLAKLLKLADSRLQAAS